MEYISFFYINGGYKTYVTISHIVQIPRERVKRPGIAMDKIHVHKR